MRRENFFFFFAFQSYHRHYFINNTTLFCHIFIGVGQGEGAIFVENYKTIQSHVYFTLQIIGITLLGFLSDTFIACFTDCSGAALILISEGCFVLLYNAKKHISSYCIFWCISRS